MDPIPTRGLDREAVPDILSVAGGPAFACTYCFIVSAGASLRKFAPLNGRAASAARPRRRTCAWARSTDLMDHASNGPGSRKAGRTMKHRWLCTAWLVAALFVPCAVAQNAVDPGADAETSALWPPGLADPGNMAAGVTDEFQEQSYRLWREGIIAGLEGDHPTTPGAVLLLAAAWGRGRRIARYPPQARRAARGPRPRHGPLRAAPGRPRRPDLRGPTARRARRRYQHDLHDVGRHALGRCCQPRTHRTRQGS